MLVGRRFLAFHLASSRSSGVFSTWKSRPRVDDVVLPSALLKRRRSRSTYHSQAVVRRWRSRERFPPGPTCGRYLSFTPSFVSSEASVPLGITVSQFIHLQIIHPACQFIASSQRRRPRSTRPSLCFLRQSQSCLWQYSECQLSWELVSTSNSTSSLTLITLPEYTALRPLAHGVRQHSTFLGSSLT